MKTVQILRLQNDGSQAPVVTVGWDDHQVSFTGDIQLIAQLQEFGVRDSIDPTKLLLPSDGVKFLEALPDNFPTPYLCASDVIDE